MLADKVRVTIDSESSRPIEIAVIQGKLTPAEARELAARLLELADLV